MAATGYSGTPLLQKLGIKEGMKIRLINEPDNYFLLIGADISHQLSRKEIPDLVHLFVTEKKTLQSLFHALIMELPKTTVIWISWYKKSAKMPTDITEDSIREIVLPTGWVDIKVCAISELWSGLKIVSRKSSK
jgi:hypothetical protein